MNPPVQYADTPGGKVAFQVVGDGPIDLLFMPPAPWDLDMAWDHVPQERYLRRLASFSRLILMTPRGTGASDPIPLGAPPTSEEWTTDFKFVLDAVGSERAALVHASDMGPPGLLFAATFPERTRSLVLIDCYPTLRRQDDYPWGMPPTVIDRMDAALVSGWGSGEILHLLAPELAEDQRLRAWFSRYERSAISPSTFRVARKTVGALDLRGVLPSIKAPTLVIAHAGNRYVRPAHGRYLAEHIPNAKYVERAGVWGLYWLHDVDGTLDEVQAFLTGTKGPPDLDDRVLATVLFTDIIGSTKRAVDLGDRRWRALLDEHDTLTRKEIERFRGRLVQSTGDGLLATFDGPARAIRCALALIDAVRPLGIEVRTGLHTGEIERRGEDVSGIAVHIAQRVMSAAGAGEVFVSGAVPPLVAGSGIEFDHRGTRELKGVPGEWRLYSVTYEA